MNDWRDVMSLGQRAVACKGWRWMPGMRDMGGNVYLGQRANAPNGVHQWCAFDRGSWEWHEDEFGLPDLHDPATLGCLRHLAEEAHGAFEIVIQVDIQPRMEGTHAWWRAIDSRGRKIQGAFGTFVCPNDGTDIKAYALVEALEAAEC